MHDSQVAHHHADSRNGSDVRCNEAQISRLSKPQYFQGFHIPDECTGPYRDMHVMTITFDIGDRMLNRAKAIAAADVGDAQLFSHTLV